MSYYRICPYCGAALDPGEKCDCGQKNRPPCRAEWEISQYILYHMLIKKQEKNF